MFNRLRIENLYDEMETEKKIDASSSNFDSLQSNIFAQKSVICDGTLNENAVCMLTSEAFPRMTNYRNNPGIKRPSLGELHDEYNIEKVSFVKRHVNLIEILYLHQFSF